MHSIRLLVRPLFYRKLKFDFIRRCHLLWYELVKLNLKRSEFIQEFQCNICGCVNKGRAVDVFDREKSSCSNCLSSLRSRGIIDVLSRKLYGKSLVLCDFPVNKSITGLGMSDWPGYAEILKEKFTYTSTFFHKEPFLDITKVNSDEFRKYNFVISSEVLEHIEAPVYKGFKNIYNLLKNRGFCVVTVPFMNFETTMEHYHNLHDFEVLRENGKTVLRNITATGEIQEFNDPVFHGGEGTTLELRSFTRSSLFEQFTRAGFSDIVFHRSSNIGFGIHWPVNWSLPISADKK